MQKLINSIQPAGIFTFNSASLTGGYDAFCTGLEYPCFILRIINDSDANVFISFDGANNHDYVQDGTVWETTVHPDEKAAWQKELKIWLKGTAGTGNIYLAGYTIRKDM